MPAPIFWPVRVATAMLMDMEGMNTKESTLPTARRALMAPGQGVHEAVRKTIPSEQRLLDYRGHAI
jgi:hypothetical protein